MTTDKKFGRRECDTCILHPEMDTKLSGAVIKLEKVTTELTDLKWIKTIGRFAIGLMVTFTLAAFGFTWTLFNKTANVLIEVNANSLVTRDVKSELKDIRITIKETNNLILEHIIDTNPIIQDVKKGK